MSGRYRSVRSFQAFASPAWARSNRLWRVSFMVPFYRHRFGDFERLEASRPTRVRFSAARRCLSSCALDVTSYGTEPPLSDALLDRCMAVSLRSWRMLVNGYL